MKSECRLFSWLSWIVSALAAARIVVASFLFFVLVVWVVVFFPFRYMRKKKGRSVFGASSLRGLWACYMLSAAFIASSFDFEKIQPAPQVRCALNLPPMAFKVSLIVRVSPITAIAFSE